MWLGWLTIPVMMLDCISTTVQHAAAPWDIVKRGLNNMQGFDEWVSGPALGLKMSPEPGRWFELPWNIVTLHPTLLCWGIQALHGTGDTQQLLKVSIWMSFSRTFPVVSLSPSATGLADFGVPSLSRPGWNLERQKAPLWDVSHHGGL